MMEEKNTQILFALLRSVLSGDPMTAEETALFSKEMLPELMKRSGKHDLSHLVDLGLYQNALIGENDEYCAKIHQMQLKAVFRYEKLNYELNRLCDALETAEIPFLPLKGSVLRQYYPEPWMRTSCDIDVLVARQDLERAIACLSENLHYTKKERATHDVSFYTPAGVHVELHFDLVEEGRANNAIDILRSVWEDASPCENSRFRYEMSDAFFYFYHIAHMAKHFETGGCGIRPFIDLWILDGIKGADQARRDELLSRGNLLRFADVSRTLSRVWFDGEDADPLSLQMQDFILHCGAFGSFSNRVALQQKKKGGRIGYLFSRMFIPYDKLKRYYPILERHCWLTPVMQIRRWFMLARPDVVRMAKNEIAINRRMQQGSADDMHRFLNKIGL